MKLLLIDDNEDITSLISKFLQSKGFETTVTNDPKIGLNLIRTRRFDSVLLDISMPDMSGIEIIHALKKENILKEQKIVIFSALVVSSNEINGLLNEPGVKCCLKKPIQLTEIISAITS